MKSLNEKQKKALIGFLVCMGLIALCVSTKVVLNLAAPTDEPTKNTEQKTAPADSGTSESSANSDPEAYPIKSTKKNNVSNTAAMECLQGYSWVSPDASTTLKFYNYKYIEETAESCITKSYSIKSTEANAQGEMQITITSADYQTNENAQDIVVSCGKSTKAGAYLSLTSQGFSLEKTYYDSLVDNPATGGE